MLSMHLAVDRYKFTRLIRPISSNVSFVVFVRLTVLSKIAPFGFVSKIIEYFKIHEIRNPS